MEGISKALPKRLQIVYHKTCISQFKQNKIMMTTSFVQLNKEIFFFSTTTANYTTCSTIYKLSRYPNFL